MEFLIPILIVLSVGYGLVAALVLTLAPPTRDLTPSARLTLALLWPLEVLFHDLQGLRARLKWEGKKQEVITPRREEKAGLSEAQLTSYMRALGAAQEPQEVEALLKKLALPASLDWLPIPPTPEEERHLREVEAAARGRAQVALEEKKKKAEERARKRAEAAKVRGQEEAKRRLSAKEQARTREEALQGKRVRLPYGRTEHQVSRWPTEEEVMLGYRRGRTACGKYFALGLKVTTDVVEAGTLDPCKGCGAHLADVETLQPFL